MSKGSRDRTRDREAFRSNHDRIFGRLPEMTLEELEAAWREAVEMYREPGPKPFTEERPEPPE